MSPDLGQLTIGGGTVTLAAYQTFLLLAAAVSVALAVHAAARLAVPVRGALTWFGLAVAGGLIGARVTDVALNPRAYGAAPGRIVALEPVGFALYGGLAVAMPIALLAARRWRVSPWRLADAAIPAVTAGIVLLRIGCFLNGCCAGLPTSLPWGVAFPTRGVGADVQALAGVGLLGLRDVPVPVHPTQLYELAGALACCAFALAVRRREVPAGVPALVFAATFLAFRAGNQVLRPSLPDSWAPAWFLPVAYALLAILATSLLARRWRPARAPVMGLAG